MSARACVLGAFALLLSLAPSCQAVDPSDFPCDGDGGECPTNYSCNLSIHFCAAALIDGGDIGTASDGGDAGPVEGPVDSGPHDGG